MCRKSWKIDTFFAGKYFFMKNILIITFLKTTDFTSLFNRTVHPLNKSYVDLSGSNNPIRENHESNPAKTERFYIKPIFTRRNFPKNPKSLKTLTVKLPKNAVFFRCNFTLTVPRYFENIVFHFF